MERDAGLVICCATSEEATVPLKWFEGCRVPLIPWAGRLHIVMGVEKHRWSALGSAPLSVDPEAIRRGRQIGAPHPPDNLVR